MSRWDFDPATLASPELQEWLAEREQMSEDLTEPHPVRDTIGMGIKCWCCSQKFPNGFRVLDRFLCEDCWHAERVMWTYKVLRKYIRAATVAEREVRAEAQEAIGGRAWQHGARDDELDETTHTIGRWLKTRYISPAQIRVLRSIEGW